MVLCAIVALHMKPRHNVKQSIASNCAINNKGKAWHGSYRIYSGCSNFHQCRSQSEQTARAPNADLAASRDPSKYEESLDHWGWSHVGQ